MRSLGIGAHPDDCEIGFGGAGPHVHSAEKIAAIRAAQAREEPDEIFSHV